MSSPKVVNENAERLKAQGNAFHVKGLYRAAYKKYSEAIKVDPMNAVYWANRAASGLAMKEYLDASHDAERATELDPKYVKAWARLGTSCHALSSWPGCIRAWKAGLSCLPPEEDSTPEQKALRSQIESGLTNALEAEKKPLSSDQAKIVPPDMQSNLPWKRAARMEEELIAKSNPKSSAFVILNAFRDFSQGVENMKKTEVYVINGQEGRKGTQALVDISNGIMRDSRTFYVDSPDWIQKYNRQVEFECALSNAWDKGGAKFVQAEAPRRLETLGWDPVRLALSITIRCWVMCGFYQGALGDKVAAIEFFRRALDVLEWGSTKWKDVHCDDRGVIFEPSFIRGVRKMYLEAMWEGYAANGPEIGHTMEDIAEVARQMIVETESNPPPVDVPLDPGFLASFWLYPKAAALAILGWYHMQLANIEENVEKRQVIYAQAAKYYTDAAGSCFEDDEKHAYFLEIALDAHWWCGSPLKITLPLCARIRSAVTEMKKIWEFSADASLMAPQYKVVLAFETKFRTLLGEYKATLDDVARPQYAEKPPPVKGGRKN